VLILSAVKEVVYISNEVAVALVLGVATLIVAFVGLVVKLVELGHH